MYWLELHVVVFILVSIQSASKVYWIVSNKPVIYGDNIILTCKTGKTDRGDACRVRQWYSDQKLLVYNGVPIDATTYRTSVSSTEFSLVIKNYTESDINIKYTCSCGFTSYTKRLGLSDNNFIVPPLRVDKNIQQSKEMLSIYIHIERVYPRPQCSVVIGERTVFDKLTLTSVKRGIFYYGTFEASFNIVYDDCGKKPTLLCYIGNEYNIVNTSGDPIRNCTVYWTVSNKPVMYGDNIILTCKTGHVLKNSVECPVRQWYGGHKDKLLLYNKVSRDVTKYEDRTNVSSTEFSLLIKNYTESDLNINYTCSCGFNSYTTRLGLNNNNFIVPPLRVDTHIQQSNETLSIYIHVERVYPRPELSIAIGERTLFDNLIFTFVKSDVFYYGTYEASFAIVADDCGKKPKLLCYIGNEYTIVTTSGEPIRNCTVRGDGGSTPGYTNTSTEACTTDILKNTWAVALSSVVLVICLILGCVTIYRRRSIQKRILTMITKTDDTTVSDVDQMYIMLDMKSKIDTQNDSGVIMDDENYSLVT